MNNLNGILLITVAMAAFALEDTFIKTMAQTLPVGQVLIMLGAISALLFGGLACGQGASLWAPAAWRRLPILRAICEAVAAVGFAAALSLIEISVVAAVFQATPLAITMGAALFLNERVGWRRWSAVLVGFVGVLIVIRPGLEGFDPASLLVLVAVFGVAARDLLTRVMDSAVPSSVISAQAFAMLMVAGLVLLWALPGPVVRSPQGAEWLQLAGGAAAGAFGYYCIVAAMRAADASAIMPFRYTRLVFSILLGMLVFGERPDAWTVLGAGLIIASGLYTFVRERQVARARGLSAA